MSHPSARRLGSVSEVLKEEKLEPAEGTSGVEVLQAETRTWLVLKSLKVLFVEELHEERADQALFEMEIQTLITEFCFVCLF